MRPMQRGCRSGAGEESPGDHVLTGNAEDWAGRIDHLQSATVNREAVLRAVAENCWALEFASEEVKCDREVVKKAVSQNGLALQYASEELRRDREVVLKAITQ